jgi:hypothetical protein
MFVVLLILWVLSYPKHFYLRKFGGAVSSVTSSIGRQKQQNDALTLSVVDCFASLVFLA